MPPRLGALGYGSANNRVGATKGFNDPTWLIGAQPGTGAWVNQSTPRAMSNGMATTAVVYDGSHYLIVGAGYMSGLWRYVEP